MPKSNNEQNSKRKERGLNVRVTQEQKTATRGDVRVNTYQKKNNKSKATKKIEEEVIDEVAEPKKIKDSVDKKIVENKIEDKKELTEKKIEKKETKKNIEKVTKEAFEEKEAKKTSEEAVEKAADKSAKNTVKETVKEVAEEAATKKVAEKPAKIPTEKVLDEKRIEEKAPGWKIKEAEKKDIKEKGVDENPNFAEFETMKFHAPKGAESKIVLRDVEKTPVEKVKLVPTKADFGRGNLPKAIKTTPDPETKLSAKEIKEREIAKAIKTATRLPATSTHKSRKRLVFSDFGWPRVVLAVACAATAVFAIAYFVNLTSTDMSLKVAAMQSGIEATYPNYIPRDYSLSDVTSASGKVIMHFKNGDSEFGITEEATTWDSDALLNEYIKENYGNDYTVVREQGLTLYMGGSWEAWVNGGILYKLSITSGSLTKKQMKTIATSM